MLRSTASKVMWVGRATVFLVGLAVILALVVGLASTALAHTGVDKKLFHLGHNNPVTAASALTGNLASKVLQVSNKGTANGSAAIQANNKSPRSPAVRAVNSGGGPALGLSVGAGKAPLAVNASAGKATNLDADKLDGKDSTEFLGKTETAADSDKVDGKDSSDFAAKAEAPGFDSYTDPNVGLLTTLSTTTTDVATITVTAPADGFVVLTGSGMLQLQHTNGSTTSARVYLTTTSGTAAEQNRVLEYLPPSAGGGAYDVTFSITRVFPVNAGDNTFYMTARSFNAGIDSHNLTGIFIKNQL